MSNNIPFIGSRISIITVSEIRYEGTLHDINTNDATVSLENVSVFGTEGRRKGINEIPSKNQVYEFIVFKGGDIKDLTVKEAPKSTIADPAIISSMPSKPTAAAVVQEVPKPAVQASTTATEPWKPTARIPLANPSVGGVSSKPTTAIPSSVTTQTVKHEAQLSSAPVTQSKSNNENRVPILEASTNNKAAPSMVTKPKSKPLHYNSEGTAQQSDNRKPARIFEEKDQRPAYKPQGEATAYPSRESFNQSHHHPHHHYYYHHREDYGYRGGRGFHHGRSHPSNARRDIYVPKSEFDIQSSNAKFNKEKLAEEILPQFQSLAIGDNLKSIHSATFYDKNHSFFDNISCETKLSEKEQQDFKVKNREELKLNVETFGRPFVPHRDYRRGGRGQYRGGRGHYHHNSNTH